MKQSRHLEITDDGRKGRRYVVRSREFHSVLSYPVEFNHPELGTITLSERATFKTRKQAEVWLDEHAEHYDGLIDAYEPGPMDYAYKAKYEAEKGL